MNGADGRIVLFGPFQLSPATRTLTRDGKAVSIGDRALDILIVLVEHAGQIVTPRELNSRVWRNLVVSPTNLRVHISALRKALGDGKDATGFIENVVGQGYCFVAPVESLTLGSKPSAVAPPASPASPMSALPPALKRMIGRDDTVRAIAADLKRDRFVTIVGPGGMGKTTVAISVAHAMLESFDHKVYFIDIGSIVDSRVLVVTVTSALGLTIQSADPLLGLLEFLQTNRVVLVFDNCEHVIDAAAALAETIFQQTLNTHLLATSREVLRVDGERAFWLGPLGTPPPDLEVDAARALTFPAVNLFVDRAKSSDNRFELTDANARTVADICGRLDGVALALEFVAGRVGTYGLNGTADLLNKRLSMQWQGRRTAIPRHQTLQALLDWSYGLLAHTEQCALRRLSVLVGSFTLDAARAIAPDAQRDEAQVDIAHSLDQLLAKSLISTVHSPDGHTTYRLLETTRHYALKKLEDSDEVDVTSERHARYIVARLQTAFERPLDLGNVRAALEWCFGQRDGGPRNVALGIELATAVAPTFVQLALWPECMRWTDAALACLSPLSSGDRRELVLLEAFVTSSMYASGADVRAFIVRAIDIARRLGETAMQLRLLASLHVYSHRATDFLASLAVGDEIGAVAHTTADETSWAIADWLRGSSEYCLGNQATALQLFESGFQHHADRDAQQLGIYYRARGLNGLARVQWLTGYPDQALQTARQALAEAADTPAVNYSYALLIVCHVFLWRGDLSTAREVIDKVMAQPLWQGRLAWFHSQALALNGEAQLRCGNVESGVGLLRSALADMKSRSEKNLMLTTTACALAEGLAALGQLDDALTVIDDAIAHATHQTQTWETPELLRVKATILISMPQPEEETAERLLRQSIELARHQNAKSWELRGTLTLARLQSAQRRCAQAHELLLNIYNQFTEGFETRDLNAAALLLKDLTYAIAHQTAAAPISTRSKSRL